MDVVVEVDFSVVPRVKVSTTVFVDDVTVTLRRFSQCDDTVWNGASHKSTTQLSSKHSAKALVNSSAIVTNQ